MKFYVSLLATALALSACQEPVTAKPAEQPASAVAEKPAQTATASEPQPEQAVASAVAELDKANAEECVFVVEGDDGMRFNVKEIPVKSTCAKFKVTLKHTGKMPKAAMGHNVVISSQADRAGVLEEGSAAGLDKDFVKEGDARVIASTKMIGGGETADLMLIPSKLDKSQAYEFYCTFPGHATVMLGTVKLVD